MTQAHTEISMKRIVMEQIEQINTVLIEFDQHDDVKTLNDKYQLDIYKAFHADIKRIMGL